MIFTIESTGGGKKCHFCDNEQDLYSINLKIETAYGDFRRVRFCTPCSKLLRRAINMKMKHG